MTQPAARLTDMTAHGGSIIYGDPTVLIGNQPAARIGDPHVCPVVTGVVPHVGGVITSASTSVIIGNANAARMGDLAGCQTVGMSGFGVPGTIGPGAAPLQVSTDEKMDAQLDKEQPARGPHAEAEVLDSDRDGTRDTARAEASAVRMRNRGQTDVGPFEIGGAHNLDVAYGRGQARSRAGYGWSGSAKGEVGMVKEGGQVWFGPAGDQGRNPMRAAGGEYDILHAEAAGDVLVGDDGQRVGLAVGGKAGAEVVGGKLIGKSDLLGVLVPGAGDLASMALRDLGYSADIHVELSGSAVSAGVGAGGHGYYDRKEERFHLGGFGTLEALAGLGLKVDISAGKLRTPDPPSGGVTGVGVGGIPNTIVTGLPTVLIG